eukprot:jgi/Mesen1/5260/ME000263S04365
MAVTCTSGLVVLSICLTVSLSQCGCTLAATSPSQRIRGNPTLQGMRALLEATDAPLLNHTEVFVPPRQQEVPRVSTTPSTAQASQALAPLPTSRAAATAGLQLLPATTVSARATLSCTNVECPANSKCGTSGGKIVCFCFTGYVVKSGSCVKRDACTGAKCPANSACKLTNGKATCYCNSGYQVVANKCVPKSVCSGVKCPAHSTCKSNGGKATCYCDSGYVVKNNQCVLPSSGDVCSGVKCPPNSACRNSNGKAACFCSAGYVVANGQCVLPSGGGGGGGSGGGTGGSGHDEWLSIHNSARAAVGVGPLTWSNSVASVALRWANSLSAQGCAMKHGDHAGLGQNLAWSSGAMTPQAAVQLWVNERAFWTYSAVPEGCRAGQQCGHYTQVVWKNTKEVGCAAVRCGTGGTIVVCDYNPPGNWVGERPY